MGLPEICFFNYGISLNSNVNFNDFLLTANKYIHTNFVIISHFSNFDVYFSKFFQNFFKETPTWCFPVNIPKILGTLILRNICERLLLHCNHFKLLKFVLFYSFHPVNYVGIMTSLILITETI